MKRSVVKVLALMAVLVTMVMAVGLPIVALAAETAEEVVYPWADLVVEGVQWGAVVTVLVQVLKRLGLKPQYAPIATWIAGLGGYVLYGLFNGQSLLAAIISGLMAIVAAPGFYEAIKQIGQVTIKKL